ncbi:hypothetical protein BC938DRAFT_478977 [Jimgerdemannia flammicorona]|uniref:F-box domain-containing protein n=1 Tax=Jimgerdemannia flammicorona TaxID=994334 RepID=A0A433QLW7_9FUNG|nr:hypothetical protein BC938DRAFT_478977 [Jimgerdemannia flammicorona]
MPSTTPTTDPHHSPITRLPPEILTHLLAFTLPPNPTLILRDQPLPLRRLLGRLRKPGERIIPLLLVSKQWTDIIAPLVWRTRTVLGTSESNQFLSTLASPQPAYNYSHFIVELTLKIELANIETLDDLLFHCPDLTSLDLKFAVYPIPLSFRFQILSHRCPRLQTLSLEDYMLGRKPFSDYSGGNDDDNQYPADFIDPHGLVPFLTSSARILTSLSLINCGIHDPRLASVCGARVTRLKGTTIGVAPNTDFHRLLLHCPNARTINLSGAEGPRLDLIPGHEMLQNLSILVPRLAPTDMTALALFPNLQTLSLATHDLLDRDLHVFAQQTLRNLRYLTIRAQSEARIADTGFRHICSLTSLYHLAISDLSRVTDAGFRHIAALNILEELEIGSLPRVSEAGLGVMARLPRLREVKLYGADELGDGVMAAFDVARLECLHLSYPRISAAAWQAFAGACVRLRKLGFGTGGLLNEGFFRTLERTALGLEELLIDNLEDGVVEACGDLRFFKENMALGEESIYWKRAE